MAIREIFEAKIVVKLEQGLVMRDAFQPRGGGFERAEKTHGAALYLLIRLGATEFIVDTEVDAVFEHGQRQEVIGNEFQSLLFAKERDFLAG